MRGGDSEEEVKKSMKRGNIVGAGAIKAGQPYEHFSGATETLSIMPLPSKKELKTTLEVFALFQWALSAFLIVTYVPILIHPRTFQDVLISQYVQTYQEFSTTVFGFNLYLVVFTSYWPITVLILTWLAFDWKTPEGGGRRFTCVRHWCLWKQYCDYFPMKLLKTYDISPSHNYILISQPHGIMSHSSFGNFATESTGFSKIFPGITPYVLTLGAFFWVPFLREHIMSLGTGNMLILVVGGLAECQYSQPGSTTLFLKNQTGFMHMALQHGVALIPAYNFGETDLYDQYIFTPGGLVSCLQKWVKSMVHIYPCAFYGHGFTKNSWGLLPYDRPVTTIVGEPLPMLKIENPSQETVAKYHALYIDALRKLFNQHKTKFGISEAHELVLV